MCLKGCSGTGFWLLAKPQTPARQPHHPSGIPTGGQFNSDSAGRGTGKQGRRRQSDVLIFIAGIIARRRVIIISVDIIAGVGILRKEISVIEEKWHSVLEIIFMLLLESREKHTLGTLVLELSSCVRFYCSKIHPPKMCPPNHLKV